MTSLPAEKLSPVVRGANAAISAWKNNAWTPAYAAEQLAGVVCELLSEVGRQAIALERINMTACYASEEDTSMQPEALLQIGKLARGEEVPGWPT